MIVDNFKGYIEGADVTKIPVNNLTYPSKNVIVSKGKVSTRGGLVNDGVVATVAEAVHSEFVWKDAPGGARPLRVHGNTLQVKYNSLWYTIFEGLDADTTRVFFATWVDANGSIVKKRLFFSDGSTNLYQWNGAIGAVASGTGTTAVLNTTQTGLQLGFDDGSGTAQTILHFIGSAVTANSEESQTNNPTAQTLSISGSFNTTPVSGDVIIAKPVTFANAISSTFAIDVVHSYKNHIVCANYDSVNLYFSHISTYAAATGLDFVQPVAASRTAATPIFMQLDGNFTAMVSRKNILWVSDADDWYKVTKGNDVNAYDLWVDVEKFENGERKGALPMAVAKYKGDIIYMCQDGTVQRITTLEVLGTDDIQLLSDDVEGLLDRLDKTDVRLYYLERAIYIILPNESTMLILDMIEGYFQPPQTMPINCMSVIDGIKYGHHNTENSTYKLFSGRNDLDTTIEAKIALGHYHGDHQFRYKAHTTMGMTMRLTATTVVTMEGFYEENGAKATDNVEIDGGTITTYAVDDDVSYATHPYAERAIGGADMTAEELRRAFVFSKYKGLGYFEFHPVLTITGTDPELHLLAFYIDDQPSARKIGDNLFISR